MPGIEQATARLRLLLADIDAKGQDVRAMVRQFRTQLDRLPQQAIYGRTGLGGVLAIMGEIEERLAHAEALQRRLEAIRARAQRELEALQLVQRVEEARAELATLRKRTQGAGQTDDETLAEIKRLEEFIAENSQRAGRTIATGE